MSALYCCSFECNRERIACKWHNTQARLKGVLHDAYGSCRSLPASMSASAAAAVTASTAATSASGTVDACATTAPLFNSATVLVGGANLRPTFAAFLASLDANALVKSLLRSSPALTA